MDYVLEIEQCYSNGWQTTTKIHCQSICYIGHSDLNYDKLCDIKFILKKKTDYTLVYISMDHVDMCGVEGKRRLCDLNVTSSSPALATRYTLCAVGQ